MAELDPVESAFVVIEAATQTLAGAAGPKALLRRFGECLHRVFGLQSAEFVRVHGRGAKTTLKRRGVRVPGIENFSDTAFAQLSSLLAASEISLAHLRDGLTELSTDDGTYAVVVVDDPHHKTGTVVAWPLPPLSPAAGKLRRLQLDHLVRLLQNESRWFRKLDRAQAMLYRDDLTGLYNYRYLEVVLDSELRRAGRFLGQFCLLFIDLDGFKPINDQFGHFTGSSVLKQVADVLRDAVREIDVAIRYGGDEFVIVLLGASCSKGLLAAERVRQHIAAKEFAVDGGGTTRLTASIGVAAYPEHARDRDTLIKMADETMYNSKRNGKNRVSVVERSAVGGYGDLDEADYAKGPSDRNPGKQGPSGT